MGDGQPIPVNQDNGKWFYGVTFSVRRCHFLPSASLSIAIFAFHRSLSLGKKRGLLVVISGIPSIAEMHYITKILAIQGGYLIKSAVSNRASTVSKQDNELTRQRTGGTAARLS